MLAKRMNARLQDMNTYSNLQGKMTLQNQHLGLLNEPTTEPAWAKMQTIHPARKKYHHVKNQANTNTI